jgi:hypothetical protein
VERLVLSMSPFFSHNLNKEKEMLKNDVTILYEPTKLVRMARKVPKTLVLKDPDSKDEYFIEPIIEGEDLATAKIFYELPLKFARRILSDPRYKLVSPERMVIQVRNPKSFSNDSVIIKACGIKRTEGAALDDAGVEALHLKRANLEVEEAQAAKEGRVPEHMKPVVKAAEKKFKKDEEQAQIDLQKKLKEDEAKAAKQIDINKLPENGPVPPPEPEKTTF